MKSRILTAALLIPLVVAAVAWEWPVALCLLAATAILLAITEARFLVGGRGYASAFGLVVLIAAILTPLFGFAPLVVALAFATAVGVGLLWAAMGRGSPTGWATAGAVLWCSAPLTAVVLLHQLGLPPSPGFGWRFASPVFEAFLPLWAGDTAAYFVGRAWGKHLFAPAISPKKTWEGAIANLLACVVVGVPIGVWVGYSWAVGLACGAAIGVLGQAGDLFESALKRRAGTKDSGSLLPGHGGILDRIDSLLFAAPAVALILTFAPGSR